MLDIFAFDQKLPKDTTLNPSVTAEALGKCQTSYHSPTPIRVTPQQHNTCTPPMALHRVGVELLEVV